MQEPAGLQVMATVSLAVHVALIAFAMLGPGRWLAREAEAPKTVMTITLGAGGEGPRTGGMTPIGGRPVQVTTPPAEARRAEPVRPPAAKTPEMTLPKPGTKPVKAAATSVKQAPDE